MIQIKKTTFSLGSSLIEAFSNPVFVIITMLSCSVIVALFLYYFPEISIWYRRVLKEFIQTKRFFNKCWKQATIKEKGFYYFYTSITYIITMICIVGAFLLIPYNYLMCIILLACILTIVYLWTRWENHFYKILEERVLSKKET